jgi:Tfp pilus assembly protein PilX
MTGAHSRSRHPLLLRGEKGIALFISLMILALMSVMSLIMVLTVSPDMLINGYYGNFRGSFYAADSGLNIARQQLINQVTSSTYVSATPCIGWGTGGTTGCTSAPLATSSAATVITNLLASGSGGYGSFTSLNSGSYATTSWPGNFELVNTTSCPSTFAAVSGTPTVTGTLTCSASAPCPGIANGTVLNTGYRYQFNYQLCALGRASGSQQVYTSEYGVITVNVAAQTTTTQQVSVSFAAFGGFINTYNPCSGPLAPGTMTGPMFTNGSWNYGTSGSYIFTDPIGQAGPNVSYWFGGTCVQTPACSDKSGGTTIAPSFGGGCNIGQAAAPLPPNDYSQQWAVLDGKGCGEGGTTCGVSLPPAPTNAQMNAALKDINGNAYPSAGTTTPGIYFSYTCPGSCPATGTMSGGGIYVVDNSSTATNITLSVGTDTTTVSGTTLLTQVYTITQGSTTTTITVPVWNSTTGAYPVGSAAYTQVASGSTTRKFSGVPMNNVISTSPQPGTILYVNGTISSLSGTAQGVAAIQDHSQVTIAASSNINITGDVLYAHEPVTQNVSDTLVAGNDYNQVLGVFTNNGNINLSSSYSNQNLQVDGALAAVGQSCASNSCGFTQSGNAISTFTNTGGQIQSNIFAANISTENTYFDRRFTSRAGFAPPWFPSTTMPENDITNAAAPSVTWPPPSRMSWTTTPQ